MPSADTEPAFGGTVFTRFFKALHSSIGYVTPNDKLHGQAEAIHAKRDEKLAAARAARKAKRKAS